MKNKEKLFTSINSGINDIFEAKSRLRRQAMAGRDNLDETIRQEFSHRIVKNLTLSAMFDQAASIHVYLSFGTEVDTKELIAAAFAAGKRVVVSVVLRNSPELIHAIITPQTKFVKGAFGIPEPLNVELLTAGQLGFSNIDLIIVPLVGFDKSCNRLGYGKGYYDRFLAKTAALRIGLGFAIQEATDIPSEPTDIPLDFIFTETDVITR